MSAPTARRLVTAGSLSLALALAAPAAALAGPSEGGGKDGKEGKGSPSSSQGSSSQGSPSSAGSSSQGASSSAGASSSSAGSSSSQGSSSSKGSSSSAGKDEGKGESKKAKKAPAERAAKGDPRGNNGTVKIDDMPFDDTPGNEPKVGCTFQIDFFGFDANDTADITLTAQAPTAGPVVWSATDRLVSRDAAGGGKDVDESITLSVDLDLKGLLGLTPHAQQGWHVKLAVDVDSAPGGAKQKVFWIKCDQPPAVAGTSTAPAPGGGETSTGTATDVAAVAPTSGQGRTTVTTRRLVGTTEQAAVGTDAQAALGSGAIALGSGAVALGSGAVALGSGAKGAGAATVSAQSAARPSALPFTGTEGLGYLLALGLSAVGVGTLAHRMGRRRATLGA